MEGQERNMERGRGEMEGQERDMERGRREMEGQERDMERGRGETGRLCRVGMCGGDRESYGGGMCCPGGVFGIMGDYGSM